MSSAKEKCSNSTESRAIPIRRVLIDGDHDLPNDYSTTPGGTMFSTTPGGTRIIYQRTFLMKCRKSPLARTPPSNLPDIPGVTMPGELKFTEGTLETGMQGKENGHEKLDTVPENENKGGQSDEQFAMDI